MNRTPILSSILVLLIGSAATPLLAAGESVPVYPGAANKTPGVPAGGPLSQLETADPVARVDAWYGERLPKNCAHQTAQGSAKYACPDKNIMITPHDGKTLITYIASMGGMFGR
ncbi:MAG: hypothetical protein QM741_16200 [Rudaea sp.]|uniref:hypothetical protein n=1 Tax=Rudaea sp. TaxID=2136325 RepID=UPI0039E3B93F